MKRYIIPGPPIPLQRPRFARGGCWDSQKTIKENIGLLLEYQHAGSPSYEGPLILNIDFFFERPKRLTRKAPIHHVIKPDLSNLIKFYEDVASGILFYDDCLITQINAAKYYSDTARTEFTITEINP